MYVGPVERDRRAAVLGGATALLHLIDFDEPFGFSVVEAMACGTPVMTSAVASLPEVVGDAAVLVDPLEVDDLARGIRRLWDDEGLRAKLRSLGLARARAFTWEATARGTLDAYAAALRR